MALRPILRFPHSHLRIVAAPIAQVDGKVIQLIDDMFATMYAENGIGLAATQIDVHQRLVVLDCAKGEEKPNPIAFVNPEIISASPEKSTHQEGCLSIPEQYADIERSKSVTVSARDRHGEVFELVCEGLLAVCIQHEIDHLNGKLFVDYLSPAKRNLIRDKMKKYEKRLAKTNDAKTPH